jgi:hypothetical protein
LPPFSFDAFAALGALVSFDTLASFDALVSSGALVSFAALAGMVSLRVAGSAVFSRPRSADRKERFVAAEDPFHG